LGLLNPPLDIGQLSGIDHRADHSIRTFRVAPAQAAHTVRDGIHKIVIDAGIHNDTVGAHADLALVQEASHHGSVCRLPDIGVPQHHQRRVAPQLQSDTLDVLPAAGNATYVAA